jgi:hypothetical protein
MENIFRQQGSNSHPEGMRRCSDEKYREAYRLVLDGMEQELDAPGQI